ncbi:MAG: hypothetical protein LBD51_03910, partial [Bifidobacteriaceae bacterium]|nr:hypothetical protein [Bifidobacteriaceae bacterium]
MRTLVTSDATMGEALACALAFDRVCAAGELERAARDNLDAVTISALAPIAWAANQAAAWDLRSIRRLQEVLATCRISQVTVISTCAVYPAADGADESWPIDPGGLAPYPRHRYDLERWCVERWDTTIVRLPRLYGGPHRCAIRNPARDLARLAALHPASTKQHYDLARLGGDLARVARLGLRLVNLVPPPLEGWRVLI